MKLDRDERYLCPHGNEQVEAAVDLEELREQLIIIPQDPFLFTGTFRENLDPVGFCSDRQLLEAVKKAK